MLAPLHYMFNTGTRSYREPVEDVEEFLQSFFGLVLLLSTLVDNQIYGLTKDHINLLIIFFLSFCCGVQNSTCALATNGFLKPTHMTGLSTDVGIMLTKVFAWKHHKEKFEEQLLILHNRLAWNETLTIDGVVRGAISFSDVKIISPLAK